MGFILLAMMLSAVNGWGLPSDDEAHGHNSVHDDSAPQGRRLSCGPLDQSCDKGCDWWRFSCDDSCNMCDSWSCACGWFHRETLGMDLRTTTGTSSEAPSKRSALCQQED